MGRIINVGQTQAKKRYAHRRSCAEVIRLLAQRSVFGAEERDMVAFLVYSLRGIWSTIEESAGVWDDRQYWKKAEALRTKWRWSHRIAMELEALIRERAWSKIPDILLCLLPHFQDITVSTITRTADWWCGAHKALLTRHGSESL